MTRRTFLVGCLLLLCLGAGLASGIDSPAFAKDGGSGSGNSGSGSGNSGSGGGDDGGGHGGDDDDDDSGDNSGSGSGGRGGDDDDDDNDDDDGGGGTGSGGSGGTGGKSPSGLGGNTKESGSAEARAAVAKGWALPLRVVMPTARKAGAGKLLDVDLRRTTAGGWVYQFLFLASDGRYREVYVDALRNRVVKVRKR